MKIRLVVAAAALLLPSIADAQSFQAPDRETLREAFDIWEIGKGAYDGRDFRRSLERFQQSREMYAAANHAENVAIVDRAVKASACMHRLGSAKSTAELKDLIDGRKWIYIKPYIGACLPFPEQKQRVIDAIVQRDMKGAE